MIAYHGTYSNFNFFDPSRLGENTDNNATSEAFAQTSHIGFWLSSDSEAIADTYDIIMICDISICNPLIIDCLETLAYWIESQEKTGEEIREMLMEQGYDGIIIEQDEEFGATSYVVFDAANIAVA